jgi:hypothetical protein
VALQRALNRHGAALTVDGQWGNDTTLRMQKKLNAGTF